MVSSLRFQAEPNHHIGWAPLPDGTLHVPYKAGPKRPLTSIDKCFALWVLSDCIMFTLLWGKSEALTNRLGFVFTSLGTRTSFPRMLIRDEKISRSPPSGRSLS